MSTRWLSVMTLDPHAARPSPTDVIERLEKRRVEARPVWKALHLQPAFEKCTFYPHEEKGSVSERLFRTGVCLPSGSNLGEANQNLVIQEILSLFGHVRPTASGRLELENPRRPSYTGETQSI